jgi:hypothetical protein
MAQPCWSGCGALIDDALLAVHVRASVLMWMSARSAA